MYGKVIRKPNPFAVAGFEEEDAVVAAVREKKEAALAEKAAKRAQNGSVKTDLKSLAFGGGSTQKKGKGASAPKATPPVVPSDVSPPSAHVHAAAQHGVGAFVQQRPGCGLWKDGWVEFSSSVLPPVDRPLLSLLPLRYRPLQLP